MRLLTKARFHIAYKIPGLRPYLLSKFERYKLDMAESRAMAFLLGINPCTLTDKQLEHSAMLLAKTFREFGLQASEAAEALVKANSSGKNT